MQANYTSVISGLRKNLILITTILVCTREETEAYEYEVGGELNVKQYLAGGKVQEVGRIPFQLYVRDCSWLVRVTSSKPLESGRSWETSCDGKYMYYFGQNRDAQDKVDWGGAVEPQGVPFAGPIPSMPVIWLALADACFFDQNSSSMSPPYSTAVLRTPFAINVVRMQLPPRLAKAITFMDDGYNRRNGQTNIKWPPPFDQGFTNAIYSASGFKNVGGLELPLEFNLTVLRPVLKSSSVDKLELDCQYQGHISYVNVGCSISNFAPDIPSGSVGEISDKRFALPTALVPIPFSYQASKWLSEQEVRKLPRFANYEMSQPMFSNFVPVLTLSGGKTLASANAMAGHYRILVIGLLVLVSIVAFGFLWISKRKRN